MISHLEQTPSLPTDIQERWCPMGDSNSHTFRHRNLNPARLPIPPTGQCLLSPRCRNRTVPFRSKRKMHPIHLTGGNLFSAQPRIRTENQHVLSVSALPISVDGQCYINVAASEGFEPSWRTMTPICFPSSGNRPTLPTRHVLTKLGQIQSVYLCHSLCSQHHTIYHSRDQLL
jgi:hypothetical protein